MAEAGRVPVRDSVGAALRFVRENWRVAVAAGVGCALALTLLSMLTRQVQALGVFVALAGTFVSAAAYAALLSAALSGAAGLQRRLWGDAGRVWASMAVIGFFLLIVFVVLSIPGFILLGVFLAPRYGAELQNANGDEAASLALMQRIASENPGLLLGFLLAYGAIWFLLTSRLYLAAPASVDNKRILTFETWAWTKGNTLRIIGARAMLLFPAYVLYSALTALVMLAVGANPLDPGGVEGLAQDNPALFALVTFVGTTLQVGLYAALEAGLSARLYRVLRPAVIPPPG